MIMFQPDIKWTTQLFNMQVLKIQRWPPPSYPILYLSSPVQELAKIGDRSKLTQLEESEIG